MGALLELIPIKDWFYAGLFVILLAFGAHEYHAIEAKGAAKETVAVQVASDAVKAAAKKKDDQLTADYSTALVNTGVTYAKAMQSADAAHADDVQRLQRRAASSGSGAHGTVGSATGPGTPPNEGSSSAGGLGWVPGSLGLELADALRADDAALIKCYADRDDLTGK